MPKLPPHWLPKLEQLKDTGLLEIYTQSVANRFRPFATSDTKVTIDVRNTETEHVQQLVSEQVLVLIGGTPHNTLLNNIDLETEQHSKRGLSAGYRSSHSCICFT